MPCQFRPKFDQRLLDFNSGIACDAVSAPRLQGAERQSLRLDEAKKPLKALLSQEMDAHRIGMLLPLLLLSSGTPGRQEPERLLETKTSQEPIKKRWMDSKLGKSRRS